MNRPELTEHREYFKRYIDMVPQGEYHALLKQNTEDMLLFMGNIPAEKHNYRYADGKWSIKEVLLHIMDTERIFAYRVLTAVRGDSESLLPMMDENKFAANADVSNRTMQDMLEEFSAVRTATLKLFENMTEEQTKLTANTSGFNTSARAIGYMIIGHALHHMNIIRERYL